MIIAVGSLSGAGGYGLLGGHGSGAGHLVYFAGPDYGMLFGFVLVAIALICATIIICTWIGRSK
jgi:hypothetical protein